MYSLRNKEEKMREKEIKLKDLLIEILLRWRAIIVWMLVGAIVMGAYSYVVTYKDERAAIIQNEEIQAEIEEQKKKLEETEDEYANKGNMTLDYLTSKLNAMQKGAVDNVLAYEDYIVARKEYMEKSILMHMDALNIPQVELSFAILSDNVEKSYSIERIYEDMIAGGLYQYIEDKNEDISMEQAAELVTITRATSGTFNGGDTFEIRIRAITEQQCKTLAENVIEYLNSKHGNIEKVMGSHIIEVVKNDFSVAMDYSIQSSQITAKHEIVTWENNVAEWKENFSEEEQRYYNYVTTGKAVTNENVDNFEETEDDYQLVKVVPASISVKMVILGLGLSAFIYMCYVIILYIFGNKLSVCDDVDDMFEVQHLGVIQCQAHEKKIFDFVDKWIYKLRDYGKRRFPEKEALGLATVAVKIAAEKEGLHKIFCIGCDIKNDTAETCSKIALELKKDNIDAVVLNNILYDQESLGKLREAKGAFLVETAGSTMYEEIVKELEILKRQDIMVLGILVVE